MAARRMFLKSFIQDDVFALLPFSVQALYLRLAIEADDDGFVNNPRTIIRLLGVGDEDLDLLVEKKLLIKFDSGIVVIRHWKLQNYIKPDRYKPTVHLEEKNQLELDELGVYNERLHTGDKVEPERTQSGSKVEPQYSIGKDSLDEDSLDKDSLDECSIGKVSIVENEIRKDYVAEATTTTTTATTTTTQQNNFNSFSSSADAAPTQEIYHTAKPQNTQSPMITDSNTNSTSTNTSTSADTHPMRANNAITSDISDELVKRAKKAPEEKKIIEPLANAFIEGEDTLRQISGPGKDVVYLTNRQVSALMNEMGYRLYSLYIEKLANFIIEKNANIKSHYDTILKWYKEDCERPFPKAIVTEEQPRVRYGNFDPAKAMAEKIKESMELGRLEAEEMNL